MEPTRSRRDSETTALRTTAAAAAHAQRQTTAVVWSLSPRSEADHAFRPCEQDTAAALGQVRRLAELGVREVTLLSGGGLLRPGWLQIAEEVVQCGMACDMITSGFGISRRLAEKMVDIGMSSCSVSVDGLEETHDHLHGRRGAWRWAMKAIESLRRAGMPTRCNTQLDRHSARELPALCEHLLSRGVGDWLLQLPRGAVGHDRLLQPVELLDIFPVLGEIARRGMRLSGANGFGEHGPYSQLVGSRRGKAAGAGGSPAHRRARIGMVRRVPALAFPEDEGTTTLWGFCAGCRFAPACRSVRSRAAARRGNNPNCHHRALTLAAGGLRERIAQGELRTEPLHAAWPSDDPLRFTLAAVQWPERWLRDEPGLVERLRGERDASVALAGTPRPTAPARNTCQPRV